MDLLSLMMVVVSESGTNSSETCEIVKCHVYGGESTLLKNESSFDVQGKRSCLFRGAHGLWFYTSIPCSPTMSYHFKHGLVKSQAQSKPRIPK